MAEGKLYFAYGSNINLDQMAQRCPDAQVVGPVTLENYELLFHGNLRGAGADVDVRGGYIHAKAVENAHFVLYFLLWNITPECERSLDYYEGYPHLYGKEPVTVHGHDGQERTVMAYVMTELCKEPSIPSFYYYNGILEGYRQNGLPTASLKQAWEHCVEEVHRETERINRSACGQLSSRRKKDRGR